MNRRRGAHIPVLSIMIGLVLMVLLIGTYWTRKNPNAFDFPSTSQEVIVQPTAPSPAPAPVVLPPEVHFQLLTQKKGNSLIVTWRNLPKNTSALNIFRARTSGTPSWSLWKTVGIDESSLSNGTTNFSLGTSGSGYTYYAQAVSAEAGNSSSSGSAGGGTILWTSGSGVPPQVTSTSTTPTGTTSSSGGGATTTPQTNTPTASSSSSPSESGGSSSSPPANTSQNNSGGITYYYSPTGMMTGSSSITNAQFSVQHTDRKIHIEWRGLPAGTTRVIISRSVTDNGPWTRIVSYSNIPDPYSIQIADETITAPYYYQLEALSDTAPLGTYGPVFLPALQ